jgi:two-component system, NtrC family, sensor histidine kinase HydH
VDHPALHGEALLRSLVEISIEVAGARSVDRVLSVAGEGVKRHGLQMVVVQYLNGDQGFLRYLNRAPVTAFGKGLLRPAPLTLTPGIEAAFKLGGPLYIADMEKWLLSINCETSFIDIALKAGFGRMVITPLTVSGKKWGALLLAASSLEEADVPALTLFSSQLYSALEVAETIERLEERNKELEAVHAIATASLPDGRSKHLLETVARAIGSDAAILHRFEPETGDFVVIGEAWGYEGPLLEQWKRFPAAPMQPSEKLSRSGPVSHFDRDSAVADAGYKQIAMVALRVDGSTVGFLSVGRKTDTPFDESELRTAEILGVQLSSLLDRARLNAEGGKRVRQLAMLYELASAGAGTGQVNPIIEKVLLQMIDAIPVDISSIHFLERKQLRLAGWKAREGGVQLPPTAEFLPVDEASISGRTVLSRARQCLSVSDFPPSTATAAAQFGVHHVLSAPLLVGDRLVGTLSVGRRADAKFTEEEAQLVESCGVHIAVILEHVRLFEDLKVSYDELAHTQAELVKHERLAALGELAAVMAHEVRNPLGVIFNSLTSLKRVLKPAGGEGDLLLQIIGEEADRLNRIVGDLLDFARPYEAQKKPISLEAIIGSAVDAAMAAVPHASANVMVQFPAELPHFQVDGHLVRQAILNLVVNALQAMPGGGVVTVLAVPEERDGNLWARIEVRDEGDGIPAATAERIFQPFFTTKATGTGLGLAVVKRIIDAHHGQVTVQARPEGGTTFTVRLPGGAPMDESERDDESEDTLPPSTAA